MSIKYGELTIVHNKEETGIFTNLSLWFGNEISIKKESNFVFLFEDGEIYDTEKNLKDFNFKFSVSNIQNLPIYFDKNDKKTYFYKKPIIENNHYKLDFKKIFSSYSKFNTSTNLPSIYNCIYYFHKSSETPEAFGIIRIKSNEYMPRFQFAYDSEEFTKEEFIYLINYIFRLI
jgi:hypothetical protein